MTQPAVSSGGFKLRGNATWTDAKSKYANDPTVIGHRPRRQADLIYTRSPSYSFASAVVGASLIGTTDSFTSDSNQLKLPAACGFLAAAY